MAVAIQEVALSRLQIREEKEALLEHLEELATEGDIAERLSAREAAMETVRWAMAADRLPRELRDYPWGLEYLAAGLLAHLQTKKAGRHPFRAIDLSMGWSGLEGLPRLLEFPMPDGVPAQPRALPPAVRPEGLRPLDTVWKLDGRLVRLGEMTGADVRRKAERAYRLAVSNERTYRLMDAVAAQVAPAQYVEHVLDDDSVYGLAVDILGAEGASALLGRALPGAPDGGQAERSELVASDAEVR